MLLKVEIDDVRATGGIFCCANYFSSIFYLSTKKKIYSSSNYISSAFFIDSGHTQNCLHIQQTVLPINNQK